MAGKYLSLLVHFTWSTAGREPWMEPSMRPNLYSYIGGIMHNKNARLISAGGISASHSPPRVYAFDDQRCRFCERSEIQFFKVDSREFFKIAKLCLAGRIRSFQREQVG